MQGPVPDASHGVPRRYSVRSILAVTTAFAMLFGVLNRLGLRASAVLVIAALVVVVGIAQMLVPRAPREATLGVGVILGIVSFLAWILADISQRGFVPKETLLSVFLFPFYLGGYVAVAYVCGTLVAGVFLLLDLAERVFGSSGRGGE